MIDNCYIAGSGNMAHFLLRAFSRAGVPVSGIYARNKSIGAAWAKEFTTVFIPEISHIPDERNSVLFLCVPDQAIEALAGALPFREHQWLLHCSGNTPITPLASFAARYGCLWPLASVHKGGSGELSDIPICIEGSDETVNTDLQSLATYLSGRVSLMNGKQRALMHLSAVLTQNFANHLFALAEELCAANGLDARLLQPMMRDWTERLAAQNAYELQTGPARRNDENTLSAHRKLLSEQPGLLEVYDTLTASIRKMYG